MSRTRAGEEGVLRDPVPKQSLPGFSNPLQSLNKKEVRNNAFLYFQFVCASHVTVNVNGVLSRGVGIRGKNIVYVPMKDPPWMPRSLPCSLLPSGILLLFHLVTHSRSSFGTSYYENDQIGRKLEAIAALNISCLSWIHQLFNIRLL